MIHRFTSKEIDRDAYDQCVASDPDTIIYAKSWYLDLVCDQWEVLMIDDYSMVMPLPTKKKWGVEYVYTPPWIQRLGLFGIEKETKLIELFYKYLRSEFHWIDYMSQNMLPMSIRGVQARENLILDLNSSYETIRKGYNSNRQRILKNKGASLGISTMSPSDFKRFYKMNSKKSGHSDSLEKLYRLLDADRKEVRILSVRNDEKNIAASVLLNDKHRIIYLVGVQSQSGRKLGASSFLIDQVIKEYAGHQLHFDFEGSMDIGVARFYKSFGADIEPYSYVKKRII